MASKRFGRLGQSAGYTMVEAMTVVGVMGAIAAYSAPSVIHFKAAQEVQTATSQVGGMLQQVRARASAEATPYLVLFQKEEVVDGERSAFALIVRDNDRSYSLTAPDEVETFALDPSIRPEIRQYGEADEAPIYASMLAPVEDRSAAADTSGSGSSGSGSGSSGSGSSGSGSSGSGSSGSGSSGSGSSGSGSGGLGGVLGGVTGLVGGVVGGTTGTVGTVLGTLRETVRDAVSNGTTFGVSEEEGVPAIAFNERGIPVSPDSPQEWGTGAGAVYLTDNANAVYAAVLSPLGEVSISRYDAATASWKK